MASSKINRRDFIQYGTVITGGLVLSPLLAHARPVAEDIAPDNLHWYQRPLRILQTVLREPDGRNYDAKAVVAYMQQTGCNTLIVNAGGIVDFFKNPLPAANVNPFMDGKDVLKEITEACSAAGIRVVGRVDFRGVEEKIYQQFPEWFSVDQNNKPIQLTYTRPQLYASCYNGYHRNEHAVEFIQYLMRNYKLDGVWHNSIGINGICYCPHCKESYQKATGKSIPLTTAGEADLDSYMTWKAATADAHMEKMKKTVKAFGEDKVYTAEVFSMFESGGRINSGIDLYNANDHFDFLVSVAFLTENSEDIHYADLGYASTIIKFLKSMNPGKEAITLYGGNGTSHRYVMEPLLDLKVWLWESLSAGGRFWNCSFTGQHPGATHDTRNAYHATETYQFVKKYEKVLTQQAPVATVGIYYSRPTRQFFRSHPVGDSFEASIKGMEAVLMENHIPYNFIPDNQVSAAFLNKYALVILPNVKCLSEKEINLLKDYVAGGGSLLASFETSLYNADATKRKDFGLADLFGCHFTGEKVNTKKDHYQFINNPKHPLVQPDSEHTELMINAGYTLLCNTDATAKKICTYVPVVGNQPPEKAWMTEWTKEYPTVVENTYQKGKVIFFTNQADQCAYEMGHPDFRNLLLRSMRYLAGAAIPLETNAPESVHMGLTRSNIARQEYVLSMVNVTSGPVRPLRNIQPVTGIVVRLNLEGKSLARFDIMRSQGNPVVKFVKGQVEITVDKLDDYFSVQLVMA